MGMLSNALLKQTPRCLKLSHKLIMEVINLKLNKIGLVNQLPTTGNIHIVSKVLTDFRICSRMSPVCSSQILFFLLFKVEVTLTVLMSPSTSYNLGNVFDKLYKVWQTIKMFFQNSELNWMWRFSLIHLNFWTEAIFLKHRK